MSTKKEPLSFTVFNKRGSWQVGGANEPAPKIDGVGLAIPLVSLSDYKILEEKLTKAKEVLNSIRWMGHPERKQIYPEFDMKRCPTCSSAEVAHLALEELEK